MSSRIFKDLGIHYLLAGIVISNFHYLALLFVSLRFLLTPSFPSLLDRFLLLYILFAFMVNFYVKKRRNVLRRQMILKARARKSARNGDKVG